MTIKYSLLLWTRKHFIKRLSSSAGHDDISTQLMKIAISYIAPQLCDIINSSFALGIVPDQMKIAKVYPLFKSGDCSLVINYRPISILPAFSKIIEKLVYKRLMSYLCDHNILYQYQFGFRPNHDTSLAVIFISLFVSLFIYLFVSLSLRLRGNGWTSLHEIFREGVLHDYMVTT